ncbi:MAG: decarboxylating 6-phosphogluconate dehydrogenase [Candidatus Micrarchaeota archaeon]|nr:decarboxylating 6-phosphogluconate dehydrogenase [Candidatus Micrarchaeota archaeon]
MKIGIIGLGRMGHNIALHLSEQNFTLVAYNRSPEPTKKLFRASKKAIPAYSIDEFCYALGRPTAGARPSTPAIIFLMVPAGQPVDDVLQQLRPRLSRGDIVIDGGNSLYTDSVRRAKALASNGIHYLDCGTSGGLEGARRGASLTIGGEKRIYQKLLPLWRALACKDGYLYCGPPGAGHYVKMVHNGMEYSILQSYGEGFALLHAAPYQLDLPAIANVWSHGSVIRSWMLELAGRSLKTDPRLSKVVGKVGGGQTGLWTAQEAKRRRVKMPALAVSLRERAASQKKETVSGRLIAYIRYQFGRHEFIPRKKK